MDLHAPVDMSSSYRTWMELDGPVETAPLSEQFSYAIKKNRTIVSNGPVLLQERKGDSLSLQIDLKTDERARTLPEDTPFLLFLRSPAASFSRRIQRNASLSLSACGIREDEPVILKLYPETAPSAKSPCGNSLPEHILPSCIRLSLPE